MLDNSPIEFLLNGVRFTTNDPELKRKYVDGIPVVLKSDEVQQEIESKKLLVLSDLGLSEDQREFFGLNKDKLEQ